MTAEADALFARLGVRIDSDAPGCRSLFINQASTAAIGTSEVDVLAKQIGSSGQIAIVSAAASAPNQNAWIGYMKQELNKYPNMKVVTTVYGNDDPATATQVTQGLLQQYPNLKGIISPTTVGILAAVGVLDTAKDRGKIALKLGSYTIGAGNTVLLGPPTVFTSANISNFNF